MSKILKVKMLSDENDRFLREWLLRTDMTLSDLNDFLSTELYYDNSVITSFYLSNGNWEQLQQFTSEDVGDDNGDISLMEDVLLGAVLEKAGDRLIYLFDPFGNRSYFMEVESIEEYDPSMNYPRLTDWSGDASDQFDVSFISDDSDIFDEIMDDFSEFEGDTVQDEWEV